MREKKSALIGRVFVLLINLRELFRAVLRQSGVGGIGKKRAQWEFPGAARVINHCVKVMRSHHDIGKGKIRGPLTTR